MREGMENSTGIPQNLPISVFCLVHRLPSAQFGRLPTHAGNFGASGTAAPADKFPLAAGARPKSLSAAEREMMTLSLDA
jgi:hypothetical protein